MAKEFSKDASEYGQKLIADAIAGLNGSISATLDETLSVTGKGADAKAVGDAIGSVASDGNYIKKSDTKNVCENIGLLDTQVKTNADAIGTASGKITALEGLIADDGTTKTLFGLVVAIDAGTGAVTLSEPVVAEEPTT